MPNPEWPLSGNYVPEAFVIHLRNALVNRNLVDAARESASGLRSAAVWLGLAAFTATFAANVVESVVGDLAPALPA